MFTGRVIGRVVATHKYPTLSGKKLLVVQPTTAKKVDLGDPIVAVDTIGTGAEEWVYLVDSKDSCFAFEEEFIPVDAAIVGIIDKADLIELEGEIE